MTVMMKKENLEFVLQGCKFPITAQLLSYCEKNRMKFIQASEMFVEHKQRQEEILLEITALVATEAKQFSDFLQQLPDDLDVVVKKGFQELKRQRNMVFPQIGRKLLFQRMDNGAFSLEDIADRLDIRAEENFAAFLEEVDSIERKDQERNFNKAIRSSSPGIAFAGMGTDVSSTVRAATQAAVLNTGVRAVHGVIGGIGSFISDALWSNSLANEKAHSAKTFKAAAWSAYKGLHAQLVDFFYDILEADFAAKVELLNIPPYGNLTEYDWTERHKILQNYRDAYEAGDVDVQRYIRKIFEAMEEDPTDLRDYYKLYRVAVRQKDEAGLAGILALVNALGYEKKFINLLAELLNTTLALPENTVEQLEKKITELLNVPGEEMATLRENLIMKHHKMKYSFWAVADGYVGEKFSFVNNVLLYQGEPFTGRVCFYIEEDFVYQGEMKNGVFDGAGSISENGELVYDGNWKNGHREGYCTVFHTVDRVCGEEVNCVYEGYFMKNRYDLTKPCKITFENGDVFEGQIISREELGRGNRYSATMVGKIVFSNGDTYSGEIYNFHPYGDGKFQTVSGETYSGKWEGSALKIGGFFSFKYCLVHSAGNRLKDETYRFISTLDRM